jgi:hypothetical protein
MGGAYNIHSRRDIYKILVLEPEGKSPLWSYWHRLELTLKSLSLHRVGFLESPPPPPPQFYQYRTRWLDFVKAVMNLRVL